MFAAGTRTLEKRYRSETRRLLGSLERVCLADLGDSTCLANSPANNIDIIGYEKRKLSGGGVGVEIEVAGGFQGRRLIVIIL